MAVTEQCARHVHRTRQARGFEDRTSPRPGEHFDFQILVKHQLIPRADSIEEVQRLAVASHQHMLSVVDEVAGVGIGE